MRLLVHGYGNPGRGDDALGPLAVERLRERYPGAAPREIEAAASARFAEGASAPGVSSGVDLDLTWSSELGPELALEISRHDATLFVDASHAAPRSAGGGRRSAALARVAPSPQRLFSTHTATPGSLLALCRELYGVEPPTYLLAIRGYRWTLGAPLTWRAARSLRRAVRLLLATIERPQRLLAQHEATEASGPRLEALPGEPPEHSNRQFTR